MRKPVDFSHAQLLLGELMSHQLWGCKKGLASFLTMEAGQGNASPEGVEHGEWHIWTKYCSWVLKEGGTAIANSESPDELIAEKVQLLNGSRIIAVDLDTLSTETTFHFSNGMTLWTTSESREAEDSQWDLFTPQGDVLIRLGNGSFEIEKGAQ